MTIDWEFLEQGYFVSEPEGDRTRTVRSELISDTAMQFGCYFAKQGKPSRNQLRGFYADAKALEAKMRGPDPFISAVSFKEHEYLVRMLKAKVAYAYGKKTGENVSREFNDFIAKCVDAIQNEHDFEAFMTLFESTVGFYFGYAKEHEEERRRGRRGRR